MAKNIDHPKQSGEERINPEPTPQPHGDGTNQPSGPMTAAASDEGEDRDDPFDLNKLRISQDFAARAGVQKVITTVPCCKPNRHEFIRVRPGESWRLETAVHEDKSTKETYLVDRKLFGELANEITLVCLFSTITRQGDVFLWPCKLPGDDRRPNAWNDSALAAARRAEVRWVRVTSNMNAGYYDTFEAAGALGEPDWPEISLQELVRLCFRGRYIDNHDHPVLRTLRGEA